jgi:hypothetical protein
MRSIAFALTALTAVSILALTAVAGGTLVGSTDTIQNTEIHSGGVAGSDEGGLWGKVILAKGDRTGTGAGAGGQKGQKKGNGNSGGKGKQKQGKKG